MEIGGEDGAAEDAGTGRWDAGDGEAEAAQGHQEEGAAVGGGQEGVAARGSPGGGFAAVETAGAETMGAHHKK